MPSPYAVTDTHALLWAATGHTRRLGRRARKCFERADAGRGVIYVPVFALIEVGEAVHAGRVSLGTSVAQWIDRLLRHGSYLAHDLTVEVALAATELQVIPERGDRLIAASAMVLGCPLITRDAEIAAAAGVEVLWD